MSTWCAQVLSWPAIFFGVHFNKPLKIGDRLSFIEAAGYNHGQEELGLQWGEMRHCVRQLDGGD